MVRLVCFIRLTQTLHVRQRIRQAEVSPNGDLRFEEDFVADRHCDRHLVVNVGEIWWTDSTPRENAWLRPTSSTSWPIQAAGSAMKAQPLGSSWRYNGLLRATRSPTLPAILDTRASARSFRCSGEHSVPRRRVTLITQDRMPWSAAIGERLRTIETGQMPKMSMKTPGTLFHSDGPQNKLGFTSTRHDRQTGSLSQPPIGTFLVAARHLSQFARRLQVRL
jgi:hypothetical protein